jgi:hypothetical protein
MGKAKGDGASKKSVQKQKQKVIEDKTFGLKNKNKSKKVQQHINSVEKNVMNSGDPKMRKMEEQRQKAKADAKARKKAAKDEQDALFGAALLAVSKKKTVDKKEGKVEAAGRDANDEGTKKSTSRAMKMMYQMDAQEMSDKLREDPNYVPSLEDEIEAQRQKKVDELKKSGKGTPVTPETFQVWQDKKRKAKSDAAKKLVEAEFKKKKGGKGLAILSGRALYEYKKELFVDRDDDDLDEVPVGTSRQASTVGDNESSDNGDQEVLHVATQVQSDLFLEGEDDELDDLED